VKRDDLRLSLEAEVEKWSAKSYEALRSELKDGYARCEVGEPYHVEVQLLEDRTDYVHVGIGVCSEHAKWSCFHPLSASFLVYRDGRVKK
jgi:hypothetical protein